MTGDELQAYVYKRTGELRELSAEYGLVEAAPTK
jgi:putative tricarboxylic transport membrane protein